MDSYGADQAVWGVPRKNRVGILRLAVFFFWLLAAKCQRKNSRKVFVTIFFFGFLCCKIITKNSMKMTIFFLCFMLGCCELTKQLEVGSVACNPLGRFDCFDVNRPFSFDDDRVTEWYGFHFRTSRPVGSMLACLAPCEVMVVRVIRRASCSCAPCGASPRGRGASSCRTWSG